MATARHLVVVAGRDPETVDALATTLRETVTVRAAYSVDALERSLDDEAHVALVTPSLLRAASDRQRRAWKSTCVVAVVTDGDAPTVADRYHAVSRTGSPSELRRRVEDLAERAVYRRRLDRYYELAARRAELRGTDDAGEELARIEGHLDRLRADLDAALDRLGAAAAFEAGLRSDDERE